MLKRYFVPIVASLLPLFSCESRPPTSQATQVVPTAVLPAAPVAAAEQAAPPDTLGTTPDSLVIAKQLKPYFRTRTVAPGLEVTIASVPVIASVPIPQTQEDLLLVLTIRYKRQVIHRDTTADGLTYELSGPTTKLLYPLWLPTGPGAGQLLVAFSHRPSKDLARRFYLQNGQVTKIDTLLTFDGPARIIAGKREFSGFYDYGEVWDDAQGRHRRMYVPTLYYEVRPTGLVLDSVLIKARATARYGAFYGFKDSAEPVILEK